MNNTPDNSLRNDIRGLYDLVTEVGRQTKNPYPLSFQDFSRVMQKESNRRGLYDKLSKRAGIGGTYEDFEKAFFNPYASETNQVEALRSKTFTLDPRKEMARQRALMDASRGEYNPYGTSEVSYRPEVRGLGTNIAPIDLVEEEDTMPEPKTPAGDLPKTTRTFGGGVVSGLRGIHGGAQIAVADLLKGFGGNSDDEKEAIHLINQMEKDGTLSLERVRVLRERLLKDLDSYTNSDIRFSGDYSKKARQADALKLIEERMQRMGQDLTPEKRAVALDAMRSDLSEKGASEDKANPFVRWKEDAKDYMRKSEVPEGTWAELGSATASVGGALAGQAISMIPGATPIGQAISWASIGAQTISSGGQAIMDMEDYAAEKGVYISPEEKATIALGYMATEFGGDALGGAVASKSISAIGKLAGGRLGKKLAVRSLAKGIAGNEGVRQSLSSMSEYAQKPLAIPLAKSAGRQIVRGAVTEGPGESLTTLAQNGALDRVWKSKEDQEAWADVAKQAVKDGIYGAWAGALMGGFGSAIQSGQVAHMHRKEGLTLVQDEKNNLYEVIGADKDQSAYLVLDRAGRQKMLPADQVVDAIHYTPQERKKSQKAYDEATEGLHPKEEVLTENQKRAGAILTATEQQQSPIYRATHPEVAEEELNSPVALAGAKQALADVLEGQNEEVRTRVDQMALVLKDGEADPTEELTKLFSDESLSDNDRQSILDVVTAQSRLAVLERSHQEAKAQMQRELTKEWIAKSVVGDETARGAVISATITDADGKPKQVYVTGGVRVVTNEDGTEELLPTDDDAPIYVYDESVDGDEKGHIVQMDDLSSPQLVAEDYLDMVQASIDEAETAFRSEVQAAEEQGAKRPQMAEEIEFPNGTRGTALKGESALTELDRILEERSSSATALPTPIESAEAFEREFADPVQTPISSVRVTQGAFEKIVGKGRLRVSGAIRPTLENPDLIIKDGDAYLYVKVYRSADGTVSHNIVSVEKSIDGENILVSIHPKTDSNLRNKIKSGGLLTLQTSANAEQGEQPQGLQSELPTDLYGKGTEKSEGEQFLSSLPRTREGEVDGLKLMSERPDDFIRYLGQLYGEDFVASLPLSKSGALDLKALTPEQTLSVNEAALGKRGAVEAARQRRSKVGAERSKLEAEVKNDLGNLEKRMALRKASEEYRLYDDYVRTAEEQARQELEAKKRAEEEALTPEERQRREEEKRQLAQEKKEREERIRLENERRRREREELERNAEGSTVREYTEDPPRQARARGARLVNGAVVSRQEPMTVEHYADAERAFSQRPGETRVPVKRTIVEAESLQASHKEGRMNPRHFIPEAQPKDRADNGLSSTAADRIASDIRPDEITGGITAYTGAPVVNGRGEVIQGNNRTDALQTMYDGAERHAKSAERYKEYLKAHASEYGMTAEQVEAMAHPVAVDVAEVSDSEAIRLGHRGQTDLESAGTDTMNAQTVGEELNSDTDPQSGQSMLVSFFNRIFNRTGANGAELSAKMDNMLNRNAEEGLQFLHENGYITDTQYKNAFETNSDGKRVVTAEAKTALKDVALYQLADVIGPRAMDIFYRLPASARNGLATFLYRDSQASFETSLAPDLGDALLVWDSLRQDPDFAGQTNFESAKIFILGKVSLFGRSELETNLGEASSLAKLLAASMQTQTEEQIASVLNQYYDLVGANETGAKTQSLMPTSKPTDTKAGAAEAVYGRVYEVPSGREKHYRFRRDGAEVSRRDVAEDFRARRDALADRITEERRKYAAAMDMSRTFGVPLKLHEDMSTLPEEVRAGFDETHFVKGWFYKGDNAVHIYLPANVDADDVRATFLHEAVGHYGCRELLGEVGYNQVLDGIANKLGKEEVLRAMSEYCNGSQDLTDLGQVRIAMDEWIAHRAESGITKKTVWESIKDFFRKVFGLSGKQIDQSAEMMADDLLRRSAENLQKRAERQQGVATEEAEVKSGVRFRARKANGEEVDLPGVSYSDVRDHRGHRFVKASDGSIDFGEIREETGLTPGKIRLSEGFQSEYAGYGLLHMERPERKEQILKAGFSSAVNFAEYVAKNYTAIFRGKDRENGTPTYILQAPTSKNNILYVELSPEEGYWDINSGGPFSFTYTKNKEIVWSLPALGHTLVTGGMEFSAQQTGDRQSGNSPQTISLDDKGTESTDGEQAKGSETRFRRAERAGDVSGAAEAAIDFMRNATPKNTTVDDVLRFLRVYHNSPHLLKKADGTFADPDTGERLGFDHRFMGSGEGAQAHGWGSYFSVKDLAGYASTYDPSVYQGMRITQNDEYVISNGGNAKTSELLFETVYGLCKSCETAPDEDAIKRYVIETITSRFQEHQQEANRQRRLLDALKDNEPWAVTVTNAQTGDIITDPKTGYRYSEEDSSVDYVRWRYEISKKMEGRYGKVLSFIESNPDYVEHFVAKVERHKYAVEIPDPDTNHYIREDRRLTKHEEEMIRKAINDKWELRDSVLEKRSWRGITGKEAYKDLSLVLGAKQASLLLNEAGFVGIHYNGHIDGECYVIFNEKDAKITDHIRFRRTSNAERLEVERKAKADGSWLLAPDGTPTTLSEDGWIASRSSDFKAEYGDWRNPEVRERSRRIEKLLKSDPIVIPQEGVIDLSLRDRKEIRQWAKENLKRSYTNRDTGDAITISTRGIKEASHHGMNDNAHKMTFAYIPQMIENSIFLYEDHRQHKGAPYAMYRYYVAGMNINGEDYTVRLSVGVDENGRRYYDHGLTQIEKKKLVDFVNQPAKSFTAIEGMPEAAPQLSSAQGKGTKSSVSDKQMPVTHEGQPAESFISMGAEPSVVPDPSVAQLKDKRLVEILQGYLPESFYQANGEPKREIVEEYLRSEEEKEVRYRRVKADPMNAISPINPQWDGEWYSSEDLTGKSTADLLELPAAPATPEKLPTQSVAEYAETMSRHYADPRVRFRTGSHKESLRAPQPPKITDGMSLYEVAQLQHEYNRNYRDFSEESMRRMGALDKYPEKFIRSQIDVARPVELFVEEMKRLGLEVSPEDNMYWSLMLQSSKELNMKKREVEPMFERYAETIREMNLDGSLEKVPSVSYVYMKDPNVKKSKSVVKDANGYEKASLYLQAKDIDECKKLGLPYRGEKGFEDLVTNKETGKKLSPEEYISLFENAVGKARAEGLCDQIRTISNWSTQKLYEAGLLTEDRYRELTRGSRRYYVPQRGFKITEETDRRAYELAELRAEGRQSLSADPVANLQAICNTTVIRAIRNRDLLDFYRWCKKNEQELYHRGVLEMGESYYRRTDEVDDKGRRVYLQSKKAPTLEEMRADNQTRREMAKIRMEKAALREKADRGLISSYTFEAKTKELDDRLKAKEDELIVKYRDPNLSLGDTDKTAKKDERVVRVYENGEERIIALSEDYSGKAVADALNNRSIGRYIDSNNIIAKVFRAWGTITRTLSSLRTQYSPAFAVKNAVRDMNAAVAANMGDFGWAYTQQFLRNVPKVQRAVWEYVWKENFGDVGDLKSGYGQYMKEFFEDGAATGYSFLEPFNILHKNLKGIAEPTTWNNIVHGRKGAKNLYATMRLCAVLSEGSELSTRFAEYVTSRERGFSRKEAAIHAKEVTVNFNRHGAVSPYLNTLFGFWNASVQGAYRWYRIPLRFMAKVSAQLFVTGMLQAYLYLRDDDDKDFTEWDLMTNLCIGDFRYPLPQNLRAFNGAGLQFMLACMGKKDWQAAVIDAAQFMAGEYLPNEAASLLNAVQWDETRGTLKDGGAQVWRDIAPTAISPMVDVITNRNFMGQPVYKMPYVRSQDDNVAHWSLGKKRTKQVYKDFAEWQWKMRGGSTERNDLMSRNGTSQLSNSKLNNPSVIEHLVEGYGGGPISGLADIGTWVEFASTGDVKELKKLQMIAPFFRQERDYTATDVKYWELTDLYRSRQQTMSNLRKAKEGEDLDRYREMTRRASELAPRMTGEQLTEKIWEDGTQDEKLYVTWLETKALLKQIDKGTVTKEEVAPTIDRLTEQFRELR